MAAAILDLLKELQQKLNIAIVFISHDISTVKSLCDEVVVLYKGKKVEHASGKAFRAGPYHPYTELLVSSVPTLDPLWLDTKPDGHEQPTVRITQNDALCRFRNRCSVSIQGQCDSLPPPEHKLPEGKSILCHKNMAL